MALTQLPSLPEAASAEPPRAKSPLLRNVTLLSASQALSWTLTLVWTVYVPRSVGPSGMGLLVLFWSAVSIFGVIPSLGTRILLVREIASDRRKAPGLLGTALIVRLAFMLPTMGGILFYIRLGAFHDQRVLVLYLAAAATLVNLLLEPLQAAFQAIERMEYLAYADMLSKSLLTACSISMVLAGFGAMSLVVLGAAMTVLVLLVTAWWARRYFTVDWGVSLGRARSLVAGSFAYWSMTVFHTAYLWLDSMILALITPAAVVGWYGVPTKLVGTTMIFPVILSTAWLPRLARAYEEGRDRLRTTARPALELGLILSLPAAAGIIIIARPLILTFYGSAFQPSIPILIILALTLPPIFLNIMCNQVLIATNRQILWTKVMAGAVVLNLAANLILIPYFQHRYHDGALGAALSLLATELAMGAVGAALTAWVFDLSSLTRFARAGLATAGMCLVTLAFRRLGLFVEMGVGALSFAALALVLRIPRQEEVERARDALAGATVRARALRPRGGRP